jgi:hypothetical protein
MDPPRPTNWSANRAKVEHARLIEPRAHPHGTELACLHEPKRPRSPARAKVTPRAYVSQSIPARPRPTHLSHLTSSPSQPFSGFTHSFGYSELNNLWYSELSYFSYNELNTFSYRAQLFYDFVSHSAIVISVILLQWPRCYSTQPFLIQCSVILSTFLSYFMILLQ